MGTYHYDEGIVAYGAVRVLDGMVPYKDFWTLYPPGEFYQLALIFKIFGISLEVTRILAIVILSLTICVIYLLVKRLYSRILGILALVLAGAWLKSYLVFNRPGQSALIIMIICAFPLLKFFDSEDNKWLIITGILCGIITLFRQDFGFYTFLAVFLAILLRQLNHSGGKSLKEKLPKIFSKELQLFLGTAISAFPVFIYLLINSAFSEFIIDAVIFPVTIYPRVRDLPFPLLKMDSIIFYIPLFVFILVVIRLLFNDWRSKINDSRIWITVFFLFSGIGLLNYTNVRTCMTHLLPTMVLVIILFIFISGDLIKKVIKNDRYSYKSFIFSILCFICMFYLTRPSFALYSKHIEIMRKPPKKDLRFLDVNRARGFYDKREFAGPLSLTIRYIQENTAKDEKIFVGNSRHDRVVSSDVMFYFLSQRHSGTKYYELHPGLTNTPRVQKKIIEDLIREDVRYIVIWDVQHVINSNELNDSSKSTGVTALDKFIKENYRIEILFNPYIILKHV